jgi:hypothetical protein
VPPSSIHFWVVQMAATNIEKISLIFVKLPGWGIP